MTSNDWPDDTKDDRHSQPEETGAWAEPGYQPAPPPAQKQGMSGFAKLLIGCGIVVALGFLVCCGGAVFLMSRVKVQQSEDPATVLEHTKRIADIEIPASFKPASTLSVDIWIVQVTMVAFAPAEGEGSLLLLQSNVSGDKESIDDFVRQINRGENDSEERNLELDPTSIVDKEFTIRGSPATFQFAKGTDGENMKTFRQVTGAFPGKEGTAILFLQIDEEHYNEEEIIKMIESIK